MIPRVLITYVARPMCVGLMYRHAFRQAGCRVVMAGPSKSEVYGIEDWGDDYEPPDMEIPVEHPLAVSQVVDRAREQFGAIDAVVMVDQYDMFYLIGQTDVPWAYLAVENWNAEQAERASRRVGAVEFHMIAHSQMPDVPLPTGSEFLPFGFDPFIHACGHAGARPYWTAWIGTHYEPRPTHWNYMRLAFDQAAPVPDYSRTLAVSEHTAFGRAPSYAGMSVAYQMSATALSASNCDFFPMRAAEALGYGCILVSDDQPVIRAVLGVPWPENPLGVWTTHDGGPTSMVEAVRRVVELPGPELRCMQERAIAFGYAGHTYYHRAKRILARLGLEGATRVVVDK